MSTEWATRSVVSELEAAGKGRNRTRQSPGYDVAWRKSGMAAG